MNFKIKNRLISENTKPYIIAEMSNNHLGSIKIAKQIILAAKEAGASAVKLQTFHPDDITLNINDRRFEIKNSLWKNQNYYQLYKKIFMPMSKQKNLFFYAKKIGITIFSSPLSSVNVDFLEKMGVPAYKIPSFEANDFNLLSRCIKTNKPIIISTGTSEVDEINEIVNFIKKKNYLKKTALLHCCSKYPSNTNNLNISFIKYLKNKYPIQIGFSDHSNSSLGATCAIANGASIIEKHITLSKKNKGPDYRFSTSKTNFKSFVDICNEAWVAMGINVRRKIYNKEFKRSLYAIQNIKKGIKFSENNIGSYRPNLGLNSKFFFDLMGKKSNKDYKFGEPIIE